MSARRVSTRFVVGTGSLVLVGLFAGCSSSSSDRGPTGGSGSGGATGAAGGTSGTASSARNSGGAGPASSAQNSGGAGPASSAQNSGGAGPSGTGGTASTSSGGASAATGGSTTASTGDATCNPSSTYQCTGTAPPAALISDFSSATAFGTWGQDVYGGTYVYPAVIASPGPCDTVSDYPITSTTSDGVWNISGNVGTYSGMGLWWMCKTGGDATSPSYAKNCVLDASAYTGIAFTVSGDAGPKGTITLHVSTPSTTAPKLDYAGNPTTCGTCTATKCGTDVSVEVTSTATPVSLTWADLGVTEANAIQAINIALADPCNYSTGTCVATAFAVNIKISNLKFTQ